MIATSQNHIAHVLDWIMGIPIRLPLLKIRLYGDTVPLSSLDVSHNPGSQGGLVKLFQEVNNTIIDNLAVHEINLGPKDIQALSQLIGSRPCNCKSEETKSWG